MRTTFKAWLGKYGEDIGVHALGHLAAAGVLSALALAWAGLHWAGPALKTAVLDWRFGVGLGSAALLAGCTYAVRVRRDRRRTGRVERTIMRSATDRTSLLLDLRTPKARRLELAFGPVFNESTAAGALGLEVFDRLVRRGMLTRLTGNDEMEFYVTTPKGTRAQARLFSEPGPAGREQMRSQLVKAMLADQACLISSATADDGGVVRLNGTVLGSGSSDPDERNWWRLAATDLLDRGLACPFREGGRWMELTLTADGVRHGQFLNAA